MSSTHVLARKRQSLGLKMLIWGFIGLWLIVAAFPFFWTLWGSFKMEADFFSKADWMNALTAPRTIAEHGRAFISEAYNGAWVQEEFWRAVVNTALVCFFVVCTSLTIGTLGGYALSRSNYRYTFWLLITALIFRAMPPITLVAGYLLPFFEWNLWGHLATTVIVLVAINQPFTLWMLHSFFQKIPKELDESAKVDGCTQFQAFRHVIIPVMWPGVITTGFLVFCSPIMISRLPQCCCQRKIRRWCQKSRVFSAPPKPKAMLCLRFLRWFRRLRLYLFWCCFSNVRLSQG